MAVIVLASASGSPGVSTTALGLTLNWHRPVLLVDADPTGSSSVFAGYFQGAQEPTGGLINLALSLREGTLADALPRETLLLDPEAPAERSAWFLPGIRAHEQAPSLLPLWEPQSAGWLGLCGGGYLTLIFGVLFRRFNKIRGPLVS